MACLLGLLLEYIQAILDYFVEVGQPRMQFLLQVVEDQVTIGKTGPVGYCSGYEVAHLLEDPRFFLASCAGKVCEKWFDIVLLHETILKTAYIKRLFSLLYHEQLK